MISLHGGEVYPRVGYAEASGARFGLRTSVAVGIRPMLWRELFSSEIEICLFGKGVSNSVNV